MGDTQSNIEPHSHFSGIFLGYGITLHHGQQGIDTRSPDCSWAEFRAVLVAARNSSDAGLDQAAAAAFGGWWATQILSRNLRDPARVALANYLPPGAPIP